MRTIVLALALAFATVSATAQTPPPATSPQSPAASAQPPAAPITLSAALKNMYNSIKRNVSESAAKMPEADYAFRPTPEVRTFGELIGHIANAHYGLCSGAKGEKNPNSADFEKTTKTKADGQKALADSIAYCDGAYDAVTDQTAMEMVKLGSNEFVRAQRLIGNIAHDNEHYGNIVTYMRLKGLVPPSTERAQQQRRPSGNP